jgi:hypothetical protein
LFSISSQLQESLFLGLSFFSADSRLRLGFFWDRASIVQTTALNERPLRFPPGEIYPRFRQIWGAWLAPASGGRKRFHRRQRVVLPARQPGSFGRWGNSARYAGRSCMIGPSPARSADRLMAERCGDGRDARGKPLCHGHLGHARARAVTPVPFTGRMPVAQEGP